MLRRLEEINGYKISATDGELGTVKDVLFDAEKWGVRHLVVDTGNWLKGNQVLISPISVRGIDSSSKAIEVDLTKQQVESAPSIASDEPVSRQYETLYNGHYGYAPYWGGPYLWGTWGVPGYSGIAPPEADPPLNSAERELEERRLAQQDDSLHSFNEVNGYNVEASDGSLGDIEDIIIDDESWKLRYFVVDTSKFLPSKDVLVPPEDVRAVVFGDAAVQMDLTKEQLKNQPEFTSVEAIQDGATEGPVTLTRNS